MGKEAVMAGQVVNYGEEFKPERDVKVIKKDGSLESFNVQKVIDAVGKSAYRALTKIYRRMRKNISASMWWIRSWNWNRSRFPFRLCTILWKALWRK